MKKFVLWIAAGALILGAVGCVDREAQKQSKVTEKVVNNPVKAVSVGTPLIDSVSETVEITGEEPQAKIQPLDLSRRTRCWLSMSRMAIQ